MVDDDSYAGDEIKWAAKLDQVREVTLVGTADLEFWRRQLQPEDLVPAHDNGRAQIMIIAADSKYMGVPFREISFSVLVRTHDGRFGQQAAFLVQAFNSCRFFAFCERKLFSTPYLHADIRVACRVPASIGLDTRNGCTFDVRMGDDTANGSRAMLANGNRQWGGPVYLPQRGIQNRRRKFFIARLSGQTQTLPYLPERDSLHISPSPQDSKLQLLTDSDFQPARWEIRPDAAHAKSRTLVR